MGGRKNQQQRSLPAQYKPVSNQWDFKDREKRAWLIFPGEPLLVLIIPHLPALQLVLSPPPSNRDIELIPGDFIHL